MVVDDDPLTNIDSRLFQPVDIGPNASGDDDHIGRLDFTITQPHDLPAANIVDARHSRAGDDLDTASAHPALNDFGALSVQHARQNVRLALYDS